MRVYVTGGYGFLGEWVVRELEAKGHEVGRHRRTDMDLTRARDVEGLFSAGLDPQAIIHCAGVVGGIVDNGRRPATYLVDNIRMGLNILDVARELKCKVVMAGSSCMYPSPCHGPYHPSNLWIAAPYEGNFGYGVAKRVLSESARMYRHQYGLDAFTCVLPNLYGPGADGSESGHFVASVIGKIREAKKAGAPTVEIMGDGTAKRELIYVQDAAKALVFALENPLGPGPMNFGTNREHTIREVVETLKILMDYEGEIVWGHERENGQFRKIMDSGAANSSGWESKVYLIEGLKRTVSA